MLYQDLPKLDVNEDESTYASNYVRKPNEKECQMLLGAENPSRQQRILGFKNDEEFSRIPTTLLLPNNNNNSNIDWQLLNQLKKRFPCCPTVPGMQCENCLTKWPHLARFSGLPSAVAMNYSFDLIIASSKHLVFSNSNNKEPILSLSGASSSSTSNISLVIQHQHQKKAINDIFKKLNRILTKCLQQSEDLPDEKKKVNTKNIYTNKYTNTNNTYDEENDLMTAVMLKEKTKYEVIDEWVQKINQDILKKVHLKMTFDPINLEDHQRTAFAVKLFPQNLLETTLYRQSDDDINPEKMLVKKQKFCNHFRTFYGTEKQTKQAKRMYSSLSSYSSGTPLVPKGRQINSNSPVLVLPKGENSGKTQYHFYVLDYKMADKVEILKFLTFELKVFAPSCLRSDEIRSFVGDEDFQKHLKDIDVNQMFQDAKERAEEKAPTKKSLQIAPPLLRSFKQVYIKTFLAGKFKSGSVIPTKNDVNYMVDNDLDTEINKHTSNRG